MTGYCSNDVIRSVSGISTTELSDDDLSGLASIAITMFNAEVAIEVGGADDEYELLVPAANDNTDTIFFTRHFPIFDGDGDADVSSTADVLVYDDLKQYLPNSITITTVDGPIGKITLSDASTDSRYAHYYWCPYAHNSPEIKMAFVYYIAALAWDRIIATSESVSVHGVSVTRKNYFRDRWLNSRNLILGRTMMGVSQSPPGILTGEDMFRDPDAEES